MLNVALINRLIAGSGIIGYQGGIACIRLLPRTNGLKETFNVNMNTTNSRCISALSSSLSNIVGNGKKSLPLVTLLPTSYTTTLILSPILVNKCRSYARLSTKPPVKSANANKTDTKSSSTATVSNTTDLFGDSAKMGLFAKFKHMYKQYWYILIPVHVVTSIGWFGGFYYLSKSGVDVPALLQLLHLSETTIQKVQGSDMGHYAIAYLCYKVATPIRYAVTLGGTTVSIKYLVQWGHIKPIPTKSQLMKMYEDTKATRTSAKSKKDDNK